MNVLDKLTEIYNKWGDKHNLSPLAVQMKKY
jgi:hypothetical protein